MIRLVTTTGGSATRTEERTLPPVERWNWWGPDALDQPAPDPYGDLARQHLRETGATILRRTRWFRTCQRLTRAWGWLSVAAVLAVALVLPSITALIDGVEPFATRDDFGAFAALSVLSVALAALVHGALGLGYTLTVRRLGSRHLGDPQTARSAARLAHEVVGQWQAGGAEFWTFRPPLPPVLVQAWRRDPWRPWRHLLTIAAVFGSIFLAIAAVHWWEALAADGPWHAPITGSGHGFLWWFTGLGLGGIGAAAVAVHLGRRHEKSLDAFVTELAELRYRHPDEVPAASVAWHPRGVDGE